MSTARTDAARVRGVLVGTTSAVVAVAAHGLAGAALPAAPSIVLLLLCSAMVGAVASSDVQGRLPVVALYLSAGQVLGHYLLVFASGHHHGSHWSASMVLAHTVAAVAVAALIVTAERLVAALAGVLWQLVVVLVALRGVGRGKRPRARWWATDLGTRTLAGSGHVTRGPPSFAAA